MSNANGLITAPVNQKSDVQYVLTGSTSGSINLSSLCTHANLNPWSKKKPVRYASDFPDRNGTWWKSILNNCGLTPFFVNDAIDLPQYIDGNMNGWIYDKPNGGTYPYRLMDFDGYYHGAEAPVRDFRIGPTTVSNRNGSTFGAWIMAVIGTQNELNFSDIRDMEYGYFAIACFRQGMNNPIVVINDVRMGTEGETAIEVDCGGWSTGTYTIYPMMANSRDGDWFYTIPNTTYATLTISSTSQLYGVYIGRYVIDTTNPIYRVNGYVGYRVSFAVSVRNNGLTSITLSSNYGKTGYSDYSQVTPWKTGEAEWSIPSITVNANSAANISVTGVVTTSLYREGTFFLAVKFTRGSITITDSVQIDTGDPWQ